MFEDRYGLQITTTSADARDAYVAAVDSILCADPRADSQLDAALQADPDFALAHAAAARQHQFHGRADEARRAIERASECVRSATLREREHVGIYELLLNGKGEQALKLIAEHLKAHPLDVMALSPASSVFGLIGFSGREEREHEQLALLEPLQTAYGDDWWFATVFAFALIETGEHERGRELVQQALSKKPDNAHGAHVYAHALYEGGDDQTALDFLSTWLPGYPDDGPMRCHLWWHLCLLHLARHDTDSVWSAYSAHCAPATSRQSPPINVLTDGLALCWRAQLAGHPVDRTHWETLINYQRERFPRPGVFVDAHYTLAAAALENWEAFDADLEQLETRGEAGRLPAGTIAAKLAHAYRDFARKQWATVIDALEPIAHQVVRVGGSRAQRDLVTNTLIAAYFKDGRAQDAQRLMDGPDGRLRTVPGSDSPA